MATEPLSEQFTEALGRNVLLREDTADRQVWADTFTGLYHVPPEGMPAPRTVLDLGANIGLTAAHYRFLWPEARIVAVEMDERNAAVAEANAPGVDVWRIAVALAEGQVFYSRDVPSEAYRVGVGKATAHALPLREIINQAYWLPSAIDFVKMDIEGMEWALLEQPDDWAPLVRHLLVELHDDRPVDDGVSLLRAAGFEARRHEPHPRAVWAWR